MEKTLEERSRTADTLFTLGPLIHNPHVLEILRRNRVIEVTEENADAGSRVIIRAHGVAPSVRRKLAERACVVIDATCPKVARVQKMALRAGEAGRKVVIAGDKDHAEVLGILGHALAGGVCISTVEEARSLELDSPALLVAQTTFSEEGFAEIAGALRERQLDIEVQNTICDATSERQEEARRMALEMDAIVIVGGRTSANTRRLAEIITGLGKPAFLVEDEGEIPPEVSRYETIGVTAGASTPNWLISRVAERLVEMQARGIRRVLWRILAFLVRSNLLVALSTLALTLLAVLWQRLQPGFAMLAVPPLYLFGIHVLNAFSESQAQEINEPAQKMFMQQNRAWLLPVAWVSLGIALLLASLGSLWAGVLTGSAIVLGLLYQVRIPFSRVQLIRIPGSKDLFTAGAWAVFTCWIPALIAEGRLLPARLHGLGDRILDRDGPCPGLRREGPPGRPHGRQGDHPDLPRHGHGAASCPRRSSCSRRAWRWPRWRWGCFRRPAALALLLPAHSLVYLRLFHSRRITGGRAFLGRGRRVLPDPRPGGPGLSHLRGCEPAGGGRQRRDPY